MGDWLPALSDALQNAAVDPSLWSGALDAISDAAGGHGVVLFNTSSPLQQLPTSRGLEEATHAYFTHGWAERDDRYKGISRLFADGVCADQYLFTPEQMAKSAYYQEFLARHGLQWSMQLAVKTESSLWSLSVQRSIGQGPFFDDEISHLRRLIRPLGDAVTIAHNVGFARIAGIADAFESLNRPCVVLCRRNRILHYNEKAEKVLAALVRSPRGEISLIRQENDRRLREIISNAHSEREGRTVTSLTDAAGHACRVQAIKLRNWSKFTFSDADTLLLFDSGEVARVSAEQLSDAFGLTKSEARLALEIARGCSLQASAETLNITYETARSRLKLIFIKTASNRQAELVVKLSMLSAPAS